MIGNYKLTKDIFKEFLNSDASTFLFFSTSKIYGDSGLFDEDSASNPESYYAESKLKAENFLIENFKTTSKSIIILRPSLIYSSCGDVKGNLLKLRKMIDFFPFVIFPKINNRRSFCSIEHIYSLIEFLENNKLKSGVYNISDNKSVSTHDLVKDMSVDKIFIGLNKYLSKILINIMYGLPKINRFSSKLFNDFVIDNTKIKKATGLSFEKKKKQMILKKFIKISFKNDINKSSDFLNKQLRNSKILIIGGAGTIGSSYIKECLVYKPSVITVVDVNENGLTELTRDLRSSNLLDYNPNYITYPVNLLSDTFDKVFFSENWDIVSNFSAHKHVRSEKDKLSVEALIKNNVYGAIKLIDLCSIKPPNYFFSVSTDKAANPVNIMGASKSIMEKIIVNKQKDFRVSTARFANVAFSNGSLLDGFNYRISKNQPLSCPIDIKRFFVSPKQSGEICLLATFLGNSGYIFFPKLDFKNDQVYFKDISLDFLKEKGLEPVVFYSEKEAKSFDSRANPGKYPIYFFKTDTSGEKTFEEFYNENEDYDINMYDSLGYIKTKIELFSTKEIVKDFNNVFDNINSTKKDIVSVIKKYVPDFKHIETGKNLDQKM